MDFFISSFFGGTARFAFVLGAPVLFSVLWFLYNSVHGKRPLVIRGLKLALLWLAVTLTLLAFDAMLLAIGMGGHPGGAVDAMSILAAALTILSYFALIPGLLFLSYRDTRAPNRQSQLPS